MCDEISVTRLDNFLATYLITKSSQNVWWHFGQLWKPLLLKTNWWGYFWGNLGYFYHQNLVTLNKIKPNIQLLQWQWFSITSNDGSHMASSGNHDIVKMMEQKRGLFFGFFLKKMDQPRSLFHLFLSFQTHITNFTTNMYVKKFPSSIWCKDSNLQPLEHESPPITTRLGLLP